MKNIIICGLIICIILTITNIKYSKKKSTECFNNDNPIMMSFIINENINTTNYKIISNSNYIYLLTANKHLYKMTPNNTFLKIKSNWYNFIINKDLGIGIKDDLSLWICNNKDSQMYKISNAKWNSIYIDFDIINNIYIVYAIKKDNTLWYTSFVENFDPVNINMDLLSNLLWKSIYIDANNNKIMGILTTGELYGWGNNDNGSLGINVKSSKTDIITTNIIKEPTLINSDKWIKIALLNNIVLGIKEDLSLWIWVETYTEDSNYIYFIFNPVLINDIKYRDIQIITNSLLNTSNVYIIAISENNELWTMGYNPKNMLGTNNTSPVINTLTLTNNTGNWKKILSFNGIFYGLKNDHTLWSWGRYNIFNNIALFDQPDISIIIRNETQIGNLKWKDIFINPIYIKNFNTFYYLGIAEDNKLYGWGFNKGNVLNLNSIDLNNNIIDHLGQSYYAVTEPILLK